MHIGQTRADRDYFEEYPMSHHLAQFNVATALKPIDHPVMADFVNQLDAVNALAEAAPGFVWRLQGDGGNATAIKPMGERDIINMSVWESIEALFDFTYQTGHTGVLRDRKRWFQMPTEAHLVLWWVPAGSMSAGCVLTAEHGVDRLKYLRAHGPSPWAFTFKQRFAPVDAQGEFSRLG